MTEPLLPTLGVDFSGDEEVILGSFEPRPPGTYRATVAEGKESIIKLEGEDTYEIRFRLQEVVQLVDGATPPKELGIISKRFYRLGPVPPTATADERKKRQNARGIFKGFYRIATGDELAAVVNWDAIRNSPGFLLRIAWERIPANKGDRRVPYTHSQWVADGKPDARGTFYQSISGFKPLETPLETPAADGA